MIQDVLAFNKRFVDSQAYKPLITNKYPDKKVAILTCMDTRLVELLPAAIGIRNGDVKILKNAGGIISHPYGSVIRSLIVAIYELGVESIWVIGHTDCGMEKMNVEQLIEKMTTRGIPQETIDRIARSGVDYQKWLGGFDSAETAVHETMLQIISHPLIPAGIVVEGLLMNSVTGELIHIETLISSHETDSIGHADDADCQLPRAK